METILISFLYLLLHLTVIIFIAFCIVWVFKLAGITIDADVLKWGRIIVILLCVIAVVIWAASLLGYGPGLMWGPRYRGIS
jgi:hypothetical protein